MTTAKDILITALRKIGADGLYNGDGECGCGLDDLEPCGYCNLSSCEPAKLNKEDRLYYPMEEQ